MLNVLLAACQCGNDCGCCPWCLGHYLSPEVAVVIVSAVILAVVSFAAGRLTK